MKATGGSAAIVLAMLWCGAVAAVIFVGPQCPLRRGGTIASATTRYKEHPVRCRPCSAARPWLTKMQLGTIVLCATMVVVCVVLWRRYPKHPAPADARWPPRIVWMDPIMNWAPYAVYNPQLWHWPETGRSCRCRPRSSRSSCSATRPSTSAPFFPAIWILRALQTATAGRLVRVAAPAHQPRGAGLHDRFRVSTRASRSSVVTAQLYIYSQVIPFGSVFAGKAYQFPLLWESSLVTLVMIPAGVLVYRDDTGKTVAEKLAQRLPFLRSRPALGTFLVMFAIVNAAYLFLYGGSFALIKCSGKATSVACPYPFPEAKVYDPKGSTRERPARPVLRRELVGMDVRSARRTTDEHHAAGRRRTLQPDERSQRRRERLSRRRPPSTPDRVRVAGQRRRRIRRAHGCVVHAVTRFRGARRPRTPRHRSRSGPDTGRSP